MRLKIAICIFIAISFAVYFISACNNNNKLNNETEIRTYFNTHTDSLLTELTVLDSFLLLKKTTTELQQQFKISRLQYKKIEPVIEYYFQGLNKRINGPALPDVKTEDNQVWPPHGFQVLEQCLYSSYHDSMATTVSNEIKLLQTDLKFAVTNLEVQHILPNHIYEMAQHQIIRLAAMGITGFDAPLSKLSLPETISSLQALLEILNSTPYKSNQLTVILNSAITYIQINNDFDGFNRMEFLKKLLMPMSLLIEKSNTLPADTMILKPHNNVLSDLMQGKSLNADFFTPYAVSHGSREKAELGRKLFFDKHLSAGNKISCGSCHKPELMFTDGMSKATDFVHSDKLQRNTPTVYYAGFQSNQFYDMRSIYIEDQVNEVMQNSSEFNFSATGIKERLLKKDEYKLLFSKAFPKADSITGFEIRTALASFIRSLAPFSSRFDEYMRGVDSAMNEEEVKGFNVFTGKGKCATCHFMPIFNGTVPPWYTKSESEIIGTPSTAVWSNAKIDGDVGRYNFNKLEELRFAFKTPTVRNAAKTAPYMHNGIYKTLDEVVEFYHRGGGAGIGINLPFQSLPFDSLQLNTIEKKAIVAFMNTLTDKKVYY